MGHAFGLIAVALIAIVSGFTATYTVVGVLRGLRRGRYHLDRLSSPYHQRNISIDQHPIYFAFLTLFYVVLIVLAGMLSFYAGRSVIRDIWDSL